MGEDVIVLGEIEADPALETRQPQHALESAPVNSKLVVTVEGAVLVSPDSGEPLVLVRPDPAAKLPVGAKITKVQSSEGETLYMAVLLNCERPESPTVHDSVLEAIENFSEIHYSR